MRILQFSLLATLATAGLALGAEQAPYTYSTISGLGARNIGSATMSGRVDAIAATREPNSKLTIFVAAASGGPVSPVVPSRTDMTRLPTGPSTAT